VANNPLTSEQILAELEDLLRTKPRKEDFCQGTDESLSWLGRAAAIVARWGAGHSLRFQVALNQITNPYMVNPGYKDLMVLLHEARNDLKMNTLGPTNIVLPRGGVFDYFDEIRKTVELANLEVFFVDPYLDAEFVSRYLPHVQARVLSRLLTSDKKLATLLPAIDLLTKQNGIAVAVRSTGGLHDRYLFVDQKSCYHSGASFKDGAKLAPTTLTQITDAFGPMWETYEKLWASATVER
jgi:hypothetical protein